MDLSSTRELLVAADTSRGHLQQQVEDLVKQLHVANEKLSVYERRPGGNAPANVEGLTSEQQLESEVAELRCVPCSC